MKKTSPALAAGAAMLAATGVQVDAQAQSGAEVSLTIDAVRDSSTLMPPASAIVFLRAAFEAEGAAIVDPGQGLALTIYHVEHDPQTEIHVEGSGVHEIVVAMEPTELVEAYRTLAARIMRPRLGTAPSVSSTLGPAQTSTTPSSETTTGTAPVTLPPSSPFTRPSSHVTEEDTFTWHPVFGLRFAAMTEGGNSYDYWYYSDPNPYSTPRMTLGLGVAGRWNASQPLSWEADLQLDISGGQSYGGGWYYYDYYDSPALSLVYLTAPVLARYRVRSMPRDIHLVAGPHASLLLSASYVESTFLGIGGNGYGVDGLRPIDVGMTLGAQFEIRPPRGNTGQRRELEFRFQRGFVPVSDETELYNASFMAFVRLFH